MAFLSVSASTTSSPWYASSSTGLKEPLAPSASSSLSSELLSLSESSHFFSALSGGASATAMASAASLVSSMSRRRRRMLWCISLSFALDLATTSRFSTASQNSVSPALSPASVALISSSWASSSRQLLPANMRTTSSCTAEWTPPSKLDRLRWPLLASAFLASSISSPQTTTMASQNSELLRSRLRCTSMSFWSSSSAGMVRPLNSLYGSVISTSLSSR
mmetsp:Transcript_30677/g.64196  ORF Transcript_30677/g.64196 Transcript_30677/m.64196 type:complete len:220 (-) Transcript_30677:588-1247(-)